MGGFLRDMKVSKHVRVRAGDEIGKENKSIKRKVLIFGKNKLNINIKNGFENI